MKNPTYEIKKLPSDDLPTAIELFALFNKIFYHKTEGERTLPGKDYLQRLLATPEFHVFVALADGKVVGGLTAYEFPMYLKEEKEAYLYDLAVEENFRRRGIARSLIDAMREYGARNGIATLFVEAHERDTDAVGFYASLGGEMEKVEHFNIYTL
jgi:aminoglycoside 3-N-acetyltransferase I